MRVEVLGRGKALLDYSTQYESYLLAWPISLWHQLLAFHVNSSIRAVLSTTAT